MAAAVVPHTSEVLMLKYILNVLAQDGGAAPAGGERLLKLFTNNVDPTKSTVIGDLTEMSTVTTGYTPLTVIGANWTIGTTSDITQAVYPEQNFTFTTNVTCYGFYVTTTEGTPKLLWVERFTNGPFTFATTGVAAITPKIKLN